MGIRGGKRGGVGERQLVADEPAGAAGLRLLLELTRETEGKRDRERTTKCGNEVNERNGNIKRSKSK